MHIDHATKYWMVNQWQCEIPYEESCSCSTINETYEEPILSCRNKYEYQNLNDIPAETTQIYFNSLDESCFNRKIYTLQNLLTLDLSHNNISSLPEALGTLPKLRDLYISNNLLGTTPQDKWKWLDQNLIQKNLETLDISCNNLRRLPLGITKLKNLQTLVVSQNQLTDLPYDFLPSRLKVLILAHNHLSHLPIIESSPSARVHSLQSLAAKCIISHSLHLEEDFRKLLPPILVDYLDYYKKYCYHCGSVTDNSIYRSIIIPRKLCNWERSAHTSMETPIIFQSYYCSIKCYKNGWELLQDELQDDYRHD